jgi:hypothetical protein
MKLDYTLNLVTSERVHYSQKQIKDADENHCPGVIQDLIQNYDLNTDDNILIGKCKIGDYVMCNK